MLRFDIPRGFNNTAQGCGTPLPWGDDTRPRRFTPTGLRRSLGMQPRWGKLMLGCWRTQGSGVPQLWATIRNPVGILNNTDYCFYQTLTKSVGNEKNGILKRYWQI